MKAKIDSDGSMIKNNNEVDNLQLFIFNNYLQVKSLMPSEFQYEVLKYIVQRGQPVTAGGIARDLSLSKQSANNILLKLTQLGFLVRSGKVHPTGGKYYIYEIAF